MTDAEEKASKPPYGSYAAFRNRLDKLADSGLPSQIDRTAFGNQSGTYISQMLGAFQWFGLIGQDEKPTEKMRLLVNADSDEYKRVLHQLILEKYPFVGDGRLDLKRGTEAQVASIFREYGYQGSTLAKSISFFLNACRDAGMDIGTYMRAPSRPRGAAKPKRGKDERAESGASNPQEKDEEKSRKGMLRIPIPLFNMEDGEIVLPRGLSDEEWEYAHMMATSILKGYRKLPSKTDGADGDGR